MAKNPDSEWFSIPQVNGTLQVNRKVYEEHERLRELRLAAGRYTLNEAALAFAEGTNERADEFLAKLMQARKNDAFPAYEPGKFTTYKSENVRDYYEEVYAKDLNTWLTANEPRTPWRFPDPEFSNGTPQSQVDSPVVTTHSFGRKRGHALTAVIEVARKSATSADDYQSVWAELVKTAESTDRPSILLGYVEGEGIKYRGDSEVKFFTKEALRKMFERAAAAR